MVFPEPAAWDAALSTESSRVAAASVKAWWATTSQEGKSVLEAPTRRALSSQAARLARRRLARSLKAVRRSAHVLAVLAGQDMMSIQSPGATGAAVGTADKGKVGSQSCIVYG
jgi:hypothetical protein